MCIISHDRSTNRFIAPFELEQLPGPSVESAGSEQPKQGWNTLSGLFTDAELQPENVKFVFYSRLSQFGSGSKEAPQARLEKFTKKALGIQKELANRLQVYLGLPLDVVAYHSRVASSLLLPPNLGFNNGEVGECRRWGADDFPDDLLSIEPYRNVVIVTEGIDGFCTKIRAIYQTLLSYRHIRLWLLVRIGATFRMPVEGRHLWAKAGNEFFMLVDLEDLTKINPVKDSSHLFGAATDSINAAKISLRNTVSLVSYFS